MYREYEVKFRVRSDEDGRIKYVLEKDTIFGGEIFYPLNMKEIKSALKETQLKTKNLKIIKVK